MKALTTEEARWIDYPHTQETKAHTYAYAILPGRYKYISQDSALVQNVAGLCYYSGFYINTTAAGGVTDEYISADKFHYNPALIEMCGAMTADIYYDGIGWLYDNDWFND